MAEMNWVAEHLDDSVITVVDPRRPMKYLAGHLPGAINVPVYKAFGADGRLLAPDALASYLAASGIGDDRSCVLYDSPEGQNAAMLAWILEYLGKSQVYLMARFFEEWKAAPYDVRYRPVEAERRSLTIKLDPARRITVEEARSAKPSKFIDFRSAEEFRGERVIGDDQPGHIPGAQNIAWRDLADLPHGPLKSVAAIRSIMSATGIALGDQVVCYCRSGPRAALGYLALREAGYAARLYDGSWAEWSRSGLPAET